MAKQSVVTKPQTSSFVPVKHCETCGRRFTKGQLASHTDRWEHEECYQQRTGGCSADQTRIRRLHSVAQSRTAHINQRLADDPNALPEVINEPDEPRGVALSREQAEAEEVTLRTRLGNPKKARGVYTDLAHTSLTPTQFSILYQLLKKADPDLTNSFQGRATAAKALGIPLNTYDWHLRRLIKKGFVRTQEFRNDDGTQAKGTGIQFCLPGEVFYSGQSWAGPRRWDRRDEAAPKPPQKHRPAGHG